jgi:uncharacterized protein YegP (UPF0339 family)
MSKFEVFGTKNGGYAWRLKAINGEILCHSEVYTSKQAAINGVNAVKRVAAFSQAYDLT